MKKKSILNYLIVFLLLGLFLIFFYFTEKKIAGFVVLGDVGGIFIEGFESGSFTTNNWNLSAASGANNWTIKTTDPNSGIYYAEAKPQSTTNPASVLEINVNTFGYNNLTFKYQRKLIGLDAADRFRVLWYNGTSWTAIEDVNSVDDLSYVSKNFTLSSNANNNLNFKIKFECTAGAVSEFCRVDDVRVEGTAISSDTTPPTITINIPSNNTFISDSLQDINFTVADSNLNTCWYGNDAYTANTTLTNCQTNMTTVTWSEGKHNVTIWVNDTSNNVNSSKVTFTIDTLKPTWSNNKTNLTASTLNGDKVYFNITLSDTNPNTYIFSWYNGTAWENTSSSWTNNQEININKTINIDVATINWTFYINDSANNLNQTPVWSVTLLADDSIPPNITFANPTTNSSNLSQNFIFANLSFADPNLKLGAIYLFNSTRNQINYTQSAISTLSINFTGLADGIYYLNASVNDSAGNKNQTETRTISLNTISIPETSSSSSGGSGGGGGGSSGGSKKLNSSASENLENNKISNLQNFSSSLSNEQIEISLVDVNRRKDFIDAEYLVKNLAEEDENVRLYFTLLDFNENVKFEIEENHLISANSEKIFGTMIPISENLNEELILIIDFKKYSSSVSESAPIRSLVSGFSILPAEKNKNNLFVIALFLLFFIFVFIVLYRIIRNRKK